MEFTQDDIQIIDFIHRLQNPWLFAGFLLLTAWSLAWKGVALWKAAKNSSLPWFIIILIANTYGILEIIYIFFFSKKKKDA